MIDGAMYPTKSKEAPWKEMKLGRLFKKNGIVIKVMAGDTIRISSQAWYTGSTQAPPTGLSPIADQLLTLTGNGGPVPGAVFRRTRTF